jgi:ferredoxin
MNIDVASHSQVRSLQCINCMECVTACPVKNTLKVGLIPVKKPFKQIILSSVEVTVKNQQITAINVTENNDDAKWFQRAYSAVASNIIRNQTADVDVVSGATYSSMGIKESVANALINAGGESVNAIVNDLPKAGKSHHGRR